MTEKIKLKIPFNEKEIKELNTGDFVELTGTIFLGRDKVHKKLSERIDEKLKEKLKGKMIYHCGPIAKKEEKWKIISAGPTTSIRVEKFMPKIIEEYKIKGIMGKGGMGKNTLKSLKENNAVYFLAVGGTAALLAKKITEVKNVFFLEEFGVPEALWEVEIKDFPAIVSMDSKGNSLHDKIKENSIKKLSELK